MTYRQGELIVASDFNTFRTDVLEVYDVGFGNVGYGQIASAGNPNIPTVAVTDPVQSAEWEAFRAVAQLCSDHQDAGASTTFPPAPELAVGEIVEAHEADDGNTYDINGSLATITANANLFDAGSVSLFSNALNSVRDPTAWMNQLQHRFTATFPTVDDARYFFNSGGQIRFRGSRSSGSGTPQNASWTQVLSDMGSMLFGYTDTTQSGGGGGWSGSAIGYYDLTTVFQQVAIGVPSSGDYSGANEVTIEARTIDGPGGANGDTGRQLEFRILYTDGHTNPFADSVDGRITSDIDYQKATASLTIISPVFSTSIGLASGT